MRWKWTREFGPWNGLTHLRVDAMEMDSRIWTLEWVDSSSSMSEIEVLQERVGVD